MQAGLNSMPIALILVFAPLLGQMTSHLDKVTDYLYSGVLMKFIYAAASKSYQINWTDSFVLLIWLAAGSGIFLLAFRRRGFAD